MSLAVLSNSKWLIQKKPFHTEQQFFHANYLLLFISGSLHHFKIPSKRYMSQVIILSAEGSSVADIAMLHYAHTKKTRGHNLGHAVENHPKQVQLIDSEMQNSFFSDRPNRSNQQNHKLK